MTEHDKNDLSEETADSAGDDSAREDEENGSASDEELQKSLDEANDKYVRLYADFENYKKVAARNKEELLKYANEGLMTDILTVIDHLELALQHASDDKAALSLAEGVKLTLKELMNVLERHGLTQIDAMGKPFDPVIHHAMSKIESEEKENTIVQEFRKGYMLKERVIRASLVGVASKQGDTDTQESLDRAGEPDTEQE